MLELYVDATSRVFGCFNPKPNTPFILVGAPLDVTASYRPGTRFAPASIRQAACNIEFYSLRSGLDFEDIGVRDLGDIAISPGVVEDNLERIAKVSHEIIENGRRLILLGGEHLVAYGVMRGLLRFKPCLLYLDAHFDLRNEYLGLKLSHASTLRRIVELLGPNRVFVVGVRAFTKNELEYAIKHGIRHVTPIQLRLLGLREIARRIKSWMNTCETLYLSVDMDVFDPAYAPGVSNPEADGVDPSSILDLLYMVLDKRLIGFDVVEVSPPHDVSDITSILAAKIVVEVATKLYSDLRLRKH